MNLKVSPMFKDTLVRGIQLLRQKYKDLDEWSAFTIYYAVHDSCTPGHEHNAKVALEKNPGFHTESMTLTDNNIAAAVRWALSEAKR